MTPTPSEDLFERYESQYVRDLEGRLIRVEEATQADLGKRLTVTIDGRPMKDVPKAVPATDDQGNVLRDEKGNVKPRLTTVYDAATWAYCRPEAVAPAAPAAPMGTGSRVSISLADEEDVPLIPDASNPIPILCHQHHQTPIGVCRLCSVMTTRKGEPGGRLIPSCQHPLVEGMEVHTVASEELVKFPGEETPRPAGEFVLKTVKVLVELLAVNNLHKDQPDDQRRYHNELLSLAERFGVHVARQGGNLVPETPFRPRPYDEAQTKFDTSSPVIQLDRNLCVLCDRCVRGCSEVKPFKVIGHTGFGNKAGISFDLGLDMKDSGCVSCGECAASCPTGALTFKGSIYDYGMRDPWKDEPLKPKTVPAEELATTELFRGVPYSYLKWNEGAVGRVELKSTDLLCRQGEYGSTAFVIEHGALAVLVNVKEGDKPAVEKQVAKMDVNDYIVGEMACLSHQPRTATLRAADGGATVLVVKRNMLHMLLRNRSARDLLGPIYRNRALSGFLRKGLFFAGLEEAVGEACITYLRRRKDVKFVQVDPNQPIFSEGNKADSFYIILRGHVTVEETVGPRRTRIRNYMGRGRAFGEIGLLTDPEVSPTVAARVPAEMQGRRTSSCTALDHVELVAVPRDAFKGLLDNVPGVRGKMEGIASGLLAGKPAPVGGQLTQHTGDGLYQGQSLLVLDLERCTRCQECVKACADSHEDGVTRLVLEGNRFDRFLVPSACRSCHDPLCLVGCPVDSIHRRPEAGARAIVIEDHCIGCGLCAHNCPFGSIHMAPRKSGDKQAAIYTRRATNCDLCEVESNGQPQCVHRCPHDAAVRMTGDKLAELVGLKVLGTA